MSSIFSWKLIYIIPIVLFSIVIHEFSHALAADKLGDPTPRNEGRLTLNPTSHLDLMGSLLIIFAGFGWGKPVSVNPRYFKNKRRDDFIVSAAGPGSNLILAFVSLILLIVVARVTGGINTDSAFANNYMGLIQEFLWQMISANIGLAVFNFIPVPPLDGYHMLSDVIKPKYAFKYAQYMQKGQLVLFVVLIFFGGMIITPVVRYVFYGMRWILLPLANALGVVL